MNKNLASAAHCRIRKTFQDNFAQFARNGVWGTCVDCPRDTNDNAYPEFCECQDRYDHHLKGDDLMEQYNRYLKHEQMLIDADD